MFPLGIAVELLVNGAWTDITQYVYQRDGLHITGGSVNWGDTPQPAQCTFTLNNRDGRFTPGYVSGAYYPYLVRNLKMRVSVTATSSSGNFYSGYRFHGEIPDWPPLSDISGNDVYVQVTATGPLRRIASGGGQGSALTRYYQALTGLYTPIAYWPCEEDPGNTGIIGTGFAGGSDMTVISGTPSWKTVSDFNGSAPIGVLNGSVWDGLTGSFGTSGDDIYLAPGSYRWVAGVSSVNCKVWGGGGGGENGFNTGPNAGGGGEFAQEATLAVTPGTAYTLIVGGGGPGGRLDSAGHNQNGGGGGFSSFQGDAVLVKANGGGGGTSAGAGAGGTGSTNTVHNNGGAGGTGAVVGFLSGGGGGGGGSGGTAAAGNTGGSTTTNTGAAGAAAVTGGGAGGRGGNAPNDAGLMAGAGPGGGGGGGGGDFTNGTARAGAAGSPGKVELVYTPASAPPWNVIRFILLVPKHGGNNGKVLLRILTGGAIARLDVIYVAGGNLQLKGYNNALTLLFTSANVFFGDGQTVMADVELANVGATVQWFLTTIVPGAATNGAFAIGTTAGAVGNVSEILAGPNGDITKTAIGHISVQYGLIPLRQVSQALNGHHTELTIDRLLRLCNEQAMDQVPEWSEGADHWGFEPGIQGWAATNAAVTQSAATAGTALVPWSFACNGTPADGSYFIATTAQAAGISPGDRLTDTLNNGKTFTVYTISAPFAGFVNVTIRPMAPVIMTSAGTVTQVVNPRSSQDYPMLTNSVWPTEGSHSLLITAAGGAGAWFASSPGGTSGQPVQPGDTVSAAADVYAPAALGAVRLDINWYNAAGTGIGGVSAPSVALAAGQVATIKITGKAPATAAFFGINVTDNETKAANTLLYADHVRVTPQMGPQTRKELAAFHREIAVLDQGILKDQKTLWGLGFRTRLALINQPAAVTLNYAQGMLSPPLAPVTDTQHANNSIIVRRARGSKVTREQPGGPVIWNVNPVQYSGGPMSTAEPPGGIGRVKNVVRAAAAADAQLAALAQHLLNLGTAPDERYPTVTVNLARASLAGNALAPLMSAVASVEIGDRIVLSNLPFWFPNATASQLVIGYTEVINPSPRDAGSPGWLITWNCVPESPWEIVATSLRRW